MGCGDVRLLRTIGGVDFTRQERATLNKLTMPYMGHSVGRWEGDTLVVEVTDFNGRNWFDRAGNFHSEALRLEERFTPITPDAIQYEVTIVRPNTPFSP